MFNERLANLWSNLVDTSIEPHAAELRKVTESAIAQINQGDLSKWLHTYDQLPESKNVQILAGNPAITLRFNDSECDTSLIDASVRALHPWRKGPFLMGNTYIDAEWRSDFKWNRLLKALPDLKNRTVLDVGCGNGYYMFRMAEHQPRLLLGVEPGLLQNIQFWSIEKYAQTQSYVLPLKVQDMPVNMSSFDVVFSMGILYHRKSPMEHLEQLKGFISQGGTLILETLIVEGDELTCLVPEGRYAQMRNVWFLPSTKMLCLWLKKIGFKKIEVIDESVTTVEEQRTTEWMQFHSLAEFLSDDMQSTKEGYAPPKRVIISCQK